MKVCHIIGGGDVGGAKTHVLSLVERLNKNIEVLLISLREGEFADDAIAMGIPTKIVRNGNMLKDVSELKKIIEEREFDVVHCHGAKANVIGTMLRRKCKIPVVTTVHSDWRLDYMGSPVKKYTFGLLNTIALRMLDGHIGVTDNFADMLIERGFDPYNVHVIYNGIDFGYEPSPKCSREEYLKSLGIPVEEDTIVCGIAARLHPVKDIATIVRAFAKLRDVCPKLYLIIGGDGEQREYLTKLVAENKLSDRIIFAGWISDMDTFVNAIDINLLSSLSESFPYSVLEAVRAKCTMVVSSVGGMPILIDHGANGLLFKPQVIDELAAHLEYLYKNPEVRRDMAEKLYEKASALYSLDKMVSNQIEIYKNVLSGVKCNKIRRGQIVVCGAYGRGNAGDDAILKALKTELCSISDKARICVMSRNPKQTRLQYRIRSIYTFNVFKMINALRHSHLYINGGGSLIQDCTSSRSIWFYLFSLSMAKLCKTPIMMYGCGIGPISRKFNRRLAAKVIDRCADVITLREPSSMEELTKMGVSRPKMHLAADPTLNLAPASDLQIESAFFSEELDINENYACIAMRKWKGFDKKLPEIAKTVEYIAKKHNLKPLLVPMERSRDLPVAQQIAALCNCEVQILKNEHDVHTMIGILSKMKIIVAMRLHALVFGAGQGIPVVGISYDEKVSNFMKYIGDEFYIEYSDFNFDNIEPYIDRALSDASSNKIKDAMLKIRENEKVNGEVAKEFFIYE